VPNTFIHLHNHLEGSIYDSALRSKEAAKKAKELGMTALAITDHGYMYKVIDFYKDCMAEGVKPILGMETYVAPRSNRMREFKIDDANYHLVLLAENNTGYQNLMKIASDAALDGFYSKPRTDIHHLRQWHDGIIASSACLGGECQEHLVNGDYGKAKEAALLYNDVFGKGNFYLELQDHGLEQQRAINPLIIKLSKETGIPLIATNDCHYLTNASYEAHDVLMAMQANTTVHDTHRKKYGSDQFYLKTQDEMKELFGYIPEALENTVKIAERCNVKLQFGVNKVPRFTVPVPYTTEGYLMEQILIGAKDRYSIITQEIQDRIDYEFSVIKNMDLFDYFLIVWDLFRFARERKILVGPGRGSGAGSLLLYTLYVTHIEPLENSLLFERFLDPSRISQADIDTDWPDDRRQEVIDYLVGLYGNASVCQIITFGMMKARKAVGDVARAIGFDSKEAMVISKLIPKDIGITLKEALEISSDLRAKYDGSSEAKHLLDIAMQVENLPAYAGTHAAGMLVADDKGLIEHVPLCRTGKGIVAQYAMTNLDDLGMLKLDLLGINTLKIIMDTVNLVFKKYGVVIDPYELYKCKDLKVLEVIRNGWTEAIFQLEGDGMTNFMKELGPTRIDEVIAGVALYRPGPMDMIPQFLEGKRNPLTIHYDFPELEPIFSETYGVMVYQEQCMKSAIAVAGYEKRHSDSLRKAIGKKKADLIAQHRTWFIDGREVSDKYDYIPGGIRTGHDKAQLEFFYDKMEKFGKYSFNKCVASETKLKGNPRIECDFYPTVEQMFYIKNNYSYAERTGNLDLNQTFNSIGYGKTFSMYPDGRIRLNRIVNISQAGFRDIYTLITESGAAVSCTDNHKIPTLNGERKLSEILPGDSVYTYTTDIFEDEILPKLDKVVSIDYSMSTMTYDVEMAAPAHNFVTDTGLVTCNSHAAAYAVLAYVTAWLKYYYPVEFMAVNMDEKRKEQTTLAKYIKHCTGDLGIEIALPSINDSETTFTPFHVKRINFSLSVKETASESLSQIVAERSLHGPYKNIVNFIERTAQILDKGTFKALAFIGAFDCFGMRRSNIVAGIEDVMDSIAKYKSALSRYKASTKSRRKFPPQLSEWLGNGSEIFPKLVEFPEDIILRMEKYYMGVYMSGHPLNKFVCSIESFSNFQLSDMAYIIDEESGDVLLSDNVRDGQKIQIVAQIAELNKFVTKARKETMAVVQIEDLNGSAKALIFHDTFEKYSSILKEDKIYKILGYIKASDDEAPFIAITNIACIEDDLHKRVVFNAGKDLDAAEHLAEYIESLYCKGDSPVYVRFGRLRILLKRRYWVDINVFDEKCDDNIKSKCQFLEW